MSSWTASSMLLNTQEWNRSPISRTWNIINTTTQKLGLLHFKVAEFKQITGEYQIVLYEWAQKKPLTNGAKHCLTSKNRFWLNCLSNSRISQDLRTEIYFLDRAAQTGEKLADVGSLWLRFQADQSHKQLDYKYPPKSLYSCGGWYGFIIISQLIL